MSVFKMGMLTFIISLGFAGYVWCNWPSEKMRLNDVNDNQSNDTRIEICPHCGCWSFAGTGCPDENCPGSK